MRRYLLHGECHLFHTAVLRQYEAVALVDRDPVSQVRKRERALPIASVGGANQVEQRVVLGNREQLAFAKHPTGRSKIATEHSNLADVRLCHKGLPLQFGDGKIPCNAMQKLSVRNGCMFKWA